MTGPGPNRTGKNQKGQLTRDCSTGLGPTRNGENQQQLTGDCSTSFGNRNGENQRGSSPETARLVLVPPETGKTNSSSPETARPVLVTQPKGKTINPGSSPETARLVLVPTETEKTNSSSPETARPVLVTQTKGKTINPWYSMNEGRGGRSHVVNEIQEHTDGVPPGCVSRPGCNSTSFQSESHPVPRGPTDPPGSIIKRQGRNIINNREQTDNTTALRQRLKRSGQRSAISPSAPQ